MQTYTAYGTFIVHLDTEVEAGSIDEANDKAYAVFKERLMDMGLSSGAIRCDGDLEIVDIVPE